MAKQDLDFSEEVRVWEGLIGDACLSVAWWRFDNQLVGVCNERSGASGELGYALSTLGQIPVGLFPKRLSVCGQRCRRLVLQGMILRLQRYLRQDAPT